MNRIVFLIYFSVALFFVYGQSSEAMRKKKVDFLISYFGHKKILPYINLKLIEKQINDNLSKVYPYERFEVKNAVIIVDPLKKSIEDAHSIIKEGFAKKSPTGYVAYQTGDEVIIFLVNRKTVSGIIKNISDIGISFYGESQLVRIKDIVKPTQFLYLGKKGVAKYIDYIETSSNKEQLKKRKIYFKDLQAELLKKYTHQNNKNLAFRLDEKKWGNVYQYIFEVLNKKKKQVIIDNVIKNAQKGVKQKGVKQKGVKQKGVKQKGVKQKGVKQKGVKQKGVKQKGVKAEDVNTLFNLTFFYNENIQKIEDVLISKERIKKRQENLAQLKKIEELALEQKKLEKQRLEQGYKILNKYKNGNRTKNSSFVKDLFVSLIVGIIISLLLFIFLPKFSILKNLFSNSSRVINMSSLDKKIGKKKPKS